jgi:hypothetical protein
VIGSAAPSGIAVAILLAATPAPATPVASASCADVNRAEVERLVDLEFKVFVDREALQVTITCDQRGPMLAVEDRRSGRRWVRALDLDHTARAARARLIALAAAELATAALTDAAAVGAPTAPDADAARPGQSATLRAAGAPPGPVSAPASSPAAVPPTAESVAVISAPAGDQTARLRLLAEVGGARFFSRLAMTTEVGLTLRHEGWRRLEAAVGLTGSLGRVTSNQREAVVTSLSLTPLLGFHHPVGPVVARIATGPRLALGRLQADAALPGDQAMSFTAPWLGWLAELGLAAPLGPRFVVELVARGGYVLSPIGGRIAGDRAIAVEGAWLGAGLSLGALL